MNNAATGVPGPATKASRQAVEKTFAVNVYGPLSVIQSVVPVMPRGGRIINIGSVGSKLGTPESPIYVASKGAMDALIFAMAKEVCVPPPQMLVLGCGVPDIHIATVGP